MNGLTPINTACGVSSNSTPNFPGGLATNTLQNTSHSVGGSSSNPSTIPALHASLPTPSNSLPNIYGKKADPFRGSASTSRPLARASISSRSSIPETYLRNTFHDGDDGFPNSNNAFITSSVPSLTPNLEAHHCNIPRSGASGPKRPLKVLDMLNPLRSNSPKPPPRAHSIFLNKTINDFNSSPATLPPCHSSVPQVTSSQERIAKAESGYSSPHPWLPPTSSSAAEANSCQCTVSLYTNEHATHCRSYRSHTNSSKDTELNTTPTEKHGFGRREHLTIPDSALPSVLEMTGADVDSDFELYQLQMDDKKQWLQSQTLPGVGTLTRRGWLPPADSATETASLSDKICAIQVQTVDDTAVDGSPRVPARPSFESSWTELRGRGTTAPRIARTAWPPPHVAPNTRLTSDGARERARVSNRREV